MRFLIHLVRSLRACWASSLLVGISLIQLQPQLLPAEQVAVSHMEGTVHGFLSLHTMDGKILATGDLIQVIHGDQVVSRLVFRFRDGSLDDETAIFTQRGSLRLVSDHHIQKGPAFPHPTDVLITASTGQVTVHFTDDSGHEKSETDHLDLPPDLANGIVLNILKNIRPETSETKVSYVAATPKPRLVKLSIVPHGEESFLVAGSGGKAMRFVMKAELGGITGAIASLAGKQPADTSVWVAGGEAPTFVKLEGPLYLGGPIWTIELTSPVWQKSPQKEIPDRPHKK
jgi:hypothetical protein